MGVVVGIMFVAGAVVVRKWLLAPESSIAHCKGEWVGVRHCVDLFVAITRELFLLSYTLLHIMSAPDRQ